jgi:hypothetical protein
MPMAKLNDRLEQYHRPLLLLFSVVAVVLIGWARFLTGPELTFSFFFLLPIIAITWLLGVRAGILISLFSALSWLVADLLMIEHYTSLYPPDQRIFQACRLSVCRLDYFPIQKKP